MFKKQRIGHDPTTILHALTDSNIVAIAVPGAGKTTLVLQVAKTFPCEKIIIVSYNTALADTTNRRLRANGDDKRDLLHIPRVDGNSDWKAML
jgi:adenylate kinase